ncbi:MAG: Aspartyl/glutamyl-tRNA(Asn/Gln) amidotransferase subunit B [Candidatus Falkowbacteria bacterium GW2011_GWF2_39_8]|uniref:Aspartyl/glutamyl-tRNA(Asn/Gln) amidotransferase subunit B n=1 Tax=Candidatus Falkowbacteria bacterium GW2011_GWF2_39_8 TaxID=1618642 RepID=A0A0G0PZM2_9BACT|nr:MAG: Aspartyl/glutamyl-tRNA(Asn/Gln) amidotransferase subunit B [Candidatus Falkowbacteria bacterium GW2011_GWF2_39_8]
MIFGGKVNSSAAQIILEEMYRVGGDPGDIMKALGLEQIQDDSHMEEIVKELINKFPEQVEQYKAGKEAVLQFLVGQGMAASKGKANPQVLSELFKKIIK